MSDNRGAESVLALKSVGFAYGSVDVLRDLSLVLAPGEFLAIVGPSGCGKSTLLSLLSGEVSPTAGTVDRRGATRTVFQSDGLFPWRSVRENVALGLRNSGNIETESAVDKMLTLVGLNDFAGHYPHQLSGGMRQRAEIARALVGPADALLLDEPFSALDYLTRLKLRGELCRLLTERPRAVVLVTHDIEEAAQLADRILVLTDRPATIRREIDLRSAAGKPRDPTDPAVVDAVHQVLVEMGLGK